MWKQNSVAISSWSQNMLLETCGGTWWPKMWFWSFDWPRGIQEKTLQLDSAKVRFGIPTLHDIFHESNWDGYNIILEYQLSKLPDLNMLALYLFHLLQTRAKKINMDGKLKGIGSNMTKAFKDYPTAILKHVVQSLVNVMSSTHETKGGIDYLMPHNKLNLRKIIWSWHSGWSQIASFWEKLYKLFGSTKRHCAEVLVLGDLVNLFLSSFGCFISILPLFHTFHNVQKVKILLICISDKYFGTEGVLPFTRHIVLFHLIPQFWWKSEDLYTQV